MIKLYKQIVLFMLSLSSVLGYGQTDSVGLISYDISECIMGQGCARNIEHRITEKGFIKDTLFLKLNSYANCGGIHNVSINLVDNDINIIFDNGGIAELDSTLVFDVAETSDTIFDEKSSIVSLAECDCFYEFNFKILGVDSNLNYQYYLNGELVLNKFTQAYLLNEANKKDSIKQLILSMNEFGQSTDIKICRIDDKIAKTYHYKVDIRETHNLYEFLVYPEEDYNVLYVFGFLLLSTDEWYKYRIYENWDDFWELKDTILEDRSRNDAR